MTDKGHQVHKADTQRCELLHEPGVGKAKSEVGIQNNLKMDRVSS
jgi:hypothetical protein